jgi:hypothetical protein
MVSVSCTYTVLISTVLGRYATIAQSAFRETMSSQLIFSLHKVLRVV